MSEGRVIQVVLQCRGCTEEAIDRHPVTMPDGTIKFGIDFKHKPACPHMRTARDEGLLDLDGLTIRFVREHPEMI